MSCMQSKCVGLRKQTIQKQSDKSSIDDLVVGMWDQLGLIKKREGWTGF